MKNSSWHICIILLFLSIAICGFAAPETALDLTSDNAQFQRSTMSVEKNTIIHARIGLDPETKNFSLRRDDSFTVLKTQKDFTGVEWAQLLVSSPKRRAMDIIVWAPTNEIGGRAFIPFAQRKRYYSMTYCYRFVKARLIQLGLVDKPLPGASAHTAAKILPKFGFTRTDRGRKNAVVNDVCVYKGGKADNGHVEIRTASGWWYGYGNKDKPITLNGHALIGCYQKGKLGALAQQ